MPKLGQTVDEVVVVAWHCRAGDTVEEGASLMTVETDKIDAEVPSPVRGTVTELLVATGDEVGTGTPLCVLDAAHDGGERS